MFDIIIIKLRNYLIIIKVNKNINNLKGGFIIAIKALLWYDVEDYITPESDDALLALIEMMDVRGIKGTFKFVAEKARVLKKRGRLDIFKKLKKHEIAYHTNMHSKHLTISEYLEPMGFKDGALEFEKRETKGFNDVSSIFDVKPTSYGQPGAAWGAQTFPVIRKWGIPTYLDSHDVISVNDKAFWYGGVLNLTNLYGIFRMDLTHDGLDKAKYEYDSLYNRLMEEKTGLLSIYYHPCEYATLEFWDGCNFSHGENTPRDKWVTPPLRTKEEMKFYVNRLGQFLDYVMSKGDVEFITASQVLDCEIVNSTLITRDEVKLLAANIGQEIYFSTENNRSLSASELFSLFMKYLKGEKLEPELIYGPEDDVKTNVSGKVKVSQIIESLNATDYPKVFEYKCLPDFYKVNGGSVNPVDMACTLAYIIANDLKENEEVDIINGFLKSSIHINENDEWGKKWIIFKEDFKVPNTIRMAKLQSWTLKQAIF